VLIALLSGPAGAAAVMVADAVSLATRQLAAPNAAASPTPAKAEPTVPGANPGTPILGDAKTRRGVGGSEGYGVLGADMEDPLRRTSITSCGARRVTQRGWIVTC
jgi:hypothetical protein